MHRWRVPSSFCVVWFARAGIGSLALALVTAGCSSGTAAGGGAAPGRGRGGRGGAQPVVTAKVTQKDVPIDIAAVGNVEAYTTISLRSQVTGQIEEAFFTEGEVVKKGDLLFKIDPRPLESALQQSQANETRDQALLKQAEAQLARDASSAEYQRLTAERQEQLVARGIISKDLAEQSRAEADAIAATVNADKAAIESAKAQLVVQQSATESARVQLSYTVIRSPIEGRTGSSTLKVGNLATANQELGTIAQLQPVYVTFTVPAMHLPTIKRHMGADKLLVIATPQDEDKAPAERTAHLRRQRRRHRDRHHQVEGDLPQHRPAAVARAVRARQPAADDARRVRRSSRARPSRPVRTGSSSSSSRRIPRWTSGR